MNLKFHSIFKKKSKKMPVLKKKHRHQYSFTPQISCTATS